MIELINQDFEKNKELYIKTKCELQKSLGNVRIEHVGSTAIPEICGKNIIDILVGAENSFEFEKFKDLITQLGYFPSKNSATEIYQFFASTESETGNGDVHIHLGIIGTERYEEFIILKNYLLTCPDEAVAYSNHKKELVKKGITDRKMYRNLKSEYVTKLIERAKQNLKK